MYFGWITYDGIMFISSIIIVIVMVVWALHD